MKDYLRAAGLVLIRFFGTTIRDSSSGAVLGKAILVVWRGNIHLIGYEGPPVMPYFLPQKEVTYWRMAVGFKTMNEVDYSRVNSPP